MNTISKPPLTGLKHPEAKCEGCPLYGETHVPNHLPIDAKVALIAESPTGYETKAKIPIAGPSGQFLDDCLEEIGITNVARLQMVQCQSRTKVVPKAAFVHCAGTVEADLKRLPQVEKVLTLGATPTKVLTGESVTLGRVGLPRYNLRLDKTTVATYHPGYIFRNANEYPSFIGDLKKLTLSEFSPWRPPEYYVIDDPDDAIDLLVHGMREFDDFVLDIEVGVDKDLMGHPERYAWLCIGIQVIKNEVFIVGENALKDSRVLQLFDQLVQTKQITNHNGKFDMAAFKDGTVNFDTMLASYVLDERQGTHALDYLAQEFLGAPDWKDAVKPYLTGPDKTYADIPRDILYKYCAYDVHNTFELRELYLATMTETELSLTAFLCRVSNMLMVAEQKGVRADLAYLDKLDVELLEQMADLEARMQATVPFEINPRSPQQVTKVLAAMGQHVKATDKDTLAIVKRKAKPQVVTFIDALLAYKKQQKLHSTYVKGLKKNLYQGRIHVTFNIHGTTTGRLSAKKPNIHNQPRGPLIRSAYIPDTEDDVFVQVDYKTAELRVLGIEAKDSYLIEVLSDPTRDIHNEVSHRFFGDTFTKDQRVRAKAVVFGLGYGREPESIAEEFDISLREATKYTEDFLALIPDFVAWRKDLVHRVLRGEDLRTHFGRTRRFHLITKQNKDDIIRQAYAFVPQSTANDLCLLAACELHEQHGTDIRILVHDSILAQTKPDEAKEVAKVIGDTMTQVALEHYSDLIPFYTDAEIGRSWGELAS